MRPDEIRAMKLCVLREGDAASFAIYQQNGFHPVALAATDIFPSLQIRGWWMPSRPLPLFALTSPRYVGAKNMCLTSSLRCWWARR